MLTSKEVLERTGVSRATLNNYISWGIVTRPEVLPPEPQDGSAPRIGYFPEGTVERIEEIQRLKRDGWSITRITEHFGIRPPPPGETFRATGGPAAEPAVTVAPGLSIGAIGCPAYLVNDNFEVVWLNDLVHSLGVSQVELPPEAVSQSIFKYLLRPAQTQARDALARFHLGLVKHRGANFARVSQQLPIGQLATLERLFDEVKPGDFAVVALTRIPNDRSASRQVCVYALQLREGILFLYVPAGVESHEAPVHLTHRGPQTGEIADARLPAMTHVAVLFAELQDSARLWAELRPDEYFELVNQIWMTADSIFRRLRGTQGIHPGDGMVCYFFAQPDSSHLLNALASADLVRDAMRLLSKEWHLRKGWPIELFMNTGVDEGQEWVGTFRSGPHSALTVLGDAVDRACHLSGFARSGEIWSTRSLLVKLGHDERQRVKFGVPRTDKDGREVFVSSSFSWLEQVAARTGPGGPSDIAFARLPVAQIVQVIPPAGEDPAASRNPG